MTERLHIATAAILNNTGEVLLSLRPAHLHQGGLWEFPGGKLEPGEDVVQALRRELKEELGIEIQTARPLIKTEYAYPDKTVLLDVWLVSSFNGIPAGLEGQEIRWVAIESLRDYQFPAADEPIITAISLPPLFLIGPEPESVAETDFSLYLQRLEECLLAGIRLFQLRAPGLNAAVYHQLACEVSVLCKAHGARLMLNAHASEVLRSGADGVHLSSQRLLQLSARPLGDDYLVSASCHNSIEVEQARRIGADFIVLGPVQATLTHPAAMPLGWEHFGALAECAGLPVYALGGMQISDTEKAWNHGGQGIAAIRGLWDRENLTAVGMICEVTPKLVSFIGQ